MKEAKRTQITEAICKQAQLMRRGGANQTEIGKLLGVNPCTISRIEAAGFDLETYQANRKAQREKEKAAKRPVVELVYDPSIAEEYRREQEMHRDMAKVPMPEGESWIEQIPKSAIIEKEAAEELPGQIRMDLTPEKPEMSDQTKLMRFQAHQADRIVKAIEENAVMLNTKLDRLNDTLCMILRAVRKE